MATVKEQMDQLMSPDDMMMPKEPVTKEKLKSAAKDLGMFAAEMIPGVGEEIAAKRFEEAVKAGDKVGAGVEAAAGIIGIVPGVGDLVAQGVRKTKAPLRKLLDKLPQKEIDALPSQPDDIGIYGYHGTARERKPDEPFFDINFARKNDQFLGEGFYFTLDPKVAEEYSNLRAFRDFDVGPIQKGKDPILTHRETGQKTTVGNLQKGLDAEGNRLAMGQTISRFDLSKLDKPFIVRTQADRKKLKENFQKIKDEGYDSVLFADFKDRSKQIMVFPEHMNKIDTSAIAGKSSSKSFREQDVSAAENLVDNPEKLQEWRDANRLPESQRQKNIPEAQQAAEELFQGNIKSKEARQRIKEVFPEPKLYTAETMPEMPTVTDVVGSMGKKAEKGILGVKGFDLEPGQRVGVRLDIPAYNEYDKWVVSIHDGKIRNGSVVGYGQAIRLKNIEFGSDPEVALDIAKGKRVAKKSGEEKPMGKATIARVFGDYVPEDPYALQEFAKKVLADKDSEWTQVGMNPYRGSYFYNKETGKVVTRADEVIQVGPLVLAKNVTEPKLSELKDLFNQKTARTKDGKLRLFNKGGVVPMKNMAQQMELFADGGLMDEGGMIDEESGNEVPPGSLREEVRDDIPANLSEGEFVFPADVVRYWGLSTLMKMRQQAKAGLQRMEDMGQMGNADEATLPDDLPFDINDLDMEEEGEYNFAVGGAVQTPGFTGIGGYVAPPAPTTGFTPYVAPPPIPTTGIQQQTTPQVSYTTATGTSNLPTFAQTVGGTPGQYDEFRTYVNDAGQTLQIPFKNGQPIYPIPEGYKLQTADGTQQPTDSTGTTPTTVTTQQDDGGPQDYGGGTTLGGVKIAGYSPEEIQTGVTKAKDRFAITGQRGLNILDILPGGKFIKGLIGDTEVGKGIFGSDPIYSQDMTGDIFGVKGGEKGLPGERYSSAVADARFAARQMLGTPMTGYVGFEKGDLDPNSGGFFDKNGIAVNMDKTSDTFGDQTKNEQGTFNYSSFSEYKNALSAGISSGWHGGKLGEKSYDKLSDKAKENYDKFAAKMGYTDHKQTEAQKAEQAKGEARLAAAKEAADAWNARDDEAGDIASTSGVSKSQAAAIADMFDDEDNNNDDNNSDNTNDGPQGDEATGGSVGDDMYSGDG